MVVNCCECGKFECLSTESDGPKKCTFCRIPYDFNDFEKLLDINQLDISFLNSYYQRLRPYLIEIFLVNQDDCECFLNFDYEYRGRDWSTSRQFSISLKEQIQYQNYLKKLNGQKYFDFFY